MLAARSELPLYSARCAGSVARGQCTPAVDADSRFRLREYSAGGVARCQCTAAETGAAASDFYSMVYCVRPERMADLKGILTSGH